MNLLDRPVWAALSTLQTSFSIGDARARRYRPEVNIFGAPRDDSAEAQAAFADLVLPGQRVAIAQVPDVVVPKGFRIARAGRGVQMVATRDLRAEADVTGLELLNDQDAPDMLALAQLTEPGPFFERTHSLGRFLGIRVDGVLAAMAGERMRLPGYTEVSAVCTHPDFRGRGYGGRLSAAVAAHIQASGATPILHAWVTNASAIRLYETLGFRIRTELHIVGLEREA